jgi:hypothetical protein
LDHPLDTENACVRSPGRLAMILYCILESAMSAAEAYVARSHEWSLSSNRMLQQASQLMWWPCMQTHASLSDPALLVWL